MKRRSFLKLIGVAVTAPTSLLQITPDVRRVLFGNVTLYIRSVTCWDIQKRTNKELLNRCETMLDKHINWIGTKING